jgi:hypothetical protein
VQVHHGEGVAIHTGPEPCVGVRECDSEVSAGERIGQLSSRESEKSSECPRRGRCGRPHDRARVRKCPADPARSQGTTLAQSAETDCAEAEQRNRRRLRHRG